MGTTANVDVNKRLQLSSAWSLWFKFALKVAYHLSLMMVVSSPSVKKTPPAIITTVSTTVLDLIMIHGNEDLTMPLPEQERIALQAAMDAAGVKFKHLILGPDHRTPVVTDFVGGLEWAMEDGETKSLSRVADTDVEGIRVSTVFIPTLVSPYDHGGRHIKQPFETMVFGEHDEGMSKRYATWAEAEEGHEEIVAELKARHDSFLKI
jgi:hypothetical protein